MQSDKLGLEKDTTDTLNSLTRHKSEQFRLLRHRACSTFPSMSGTCRKGALLRYVRLEYRVKTLVDTPRRLQTAGLSQSGLPQVFSTKFERAVSKYRKAFKENYQKP